MDGDCQGGVRRWPENLGSRLRRGYEYVFGRTSPPFPDDGSNGALPAIHPLAQTTTRISVARLASPLSCYPVIFRNSRLLFRKASYDP